MANVFPEKVGPECSLATTRHVIQKGPHYPTLSPYSTSFFWEKIIKRTHRRFSIILTEEDSTKRFGTTIPISRNTSVDHINCKPRLICN